MKEIYNGETVALGGPNMVTKELVVDESTGKKAKFTYDKTTGAIAVQDEVDEDSINPVTGRAVAKAIEEGGGGSSYTAGDGIAISEGEISAKVDGSTIGINADGELEAIGGGGGGSSYTAGNGISIDGNNKISVDFDTQTLRMGRDQALTAQSDYALRNIFNTYGLSQIKTNRPIIMPTFSGNVHLVAGSADGYAVCKTSVAFTGGTYPGSEFTMDIPETGAANWDITGTIYNWNSLPVFITVVGTSGDTNSPNGETAIAIRNTSDTSDIYFTGIVNATKLAVKNPIPAATAADAGKVLQVQSNGTLAWVTLS
jgi:hypothetical protein